MIELVKNFIEKFYEAGHVLSLIQQADVRVTIKGELETVQLEIKQGSISILQNHEVPQGNYEIRGNKQAMKQLFEGTSRLRDLERRGQLSIAMPLRITLLLESLFFLTKAQQNFAKVI